MRTDSIPMPPDPSPVTAADNPTAPATGERGAPAATLTAADSARCWLCMGLGGIAIHIKWTEARGGGKPLWTAHEYPSDDPHPTLPCPACAANGHALGREIIAKHGVDRYPTVPSNYRHLIDEAGELGEAVMNWYAGPSPELWAKIRKEYGDVGLTAFTLGDKLGLDLAECMREVVDGETRRFAP